MQRSSQAIQHKNAILRYEFAGSGEKALLLFHGFGQSKAVFRELGEVFSSRYTVYAFDLFFHGQSEWKNGEQPLEKEVWKEMMHQFLTEQKITSFSILGFSLGGKFALATLEAFPHQTKEIFLLAADGIKTNFWYSLATYPVALRSLFKSMILKPGRFRTITSLCHKLGLIDKGIIRFAESQMDTEEKRKRVYYSWVVFRHLKFNLKELASIINSNNIQTTVIVGQFDKIVTARNMKGLINKLVNKKFEILETGHNGLIRAWTTLQSESQY